MVQKSVAVIERGKVSSAAYHYRFALRGGIYFDNPAHIEYMQGDVNHQGYEP